MFGRVTAAAAAAAVHVAAAVGERIATFREAAWQAQRAAVTAHVTAVICCRDRRDRPRTGCMEEEGSSGHGGDLIILRRMCPRAAPA